jgi:hypothetical protein
MGILETGIDSPVSMLSLMMQSPASRRLSQGNCVKDGSETSYTSPGTRSPDSAARQKPFLSTRTSHSNREISLKRFIVDLVSMTVVVMLNTEIMKIANA